jgi:hypothetical protein
LRGPEPFNLDVETTAWLPGLAELVFASASDVVDSAKGKFWESDNPTWKTPSSKSCACAPPPTRFTRAQ